MDKESRRLEVENNYSFSIISDKPSILNEVYSLPNSLSLSLFDD